MTATCMAKGRTLYLNGEPFSKQRAFCHSNSRWASFLFRQWKIRAEYVLKKRSLNFLEPQAYCKLLNRVIHCFKQNILNSFCLCFVTVLSEPWVIDCLEIKILMRFCFKYFETFLFVFGDRPCECPFWGMSHWLSWVKFFETFLL